ncbi:MAG TPA: cytochrome P450 [Pseudonocardiaceae bacterium]|nr:cytochrome P450 [Pseudonocardiaceae bacterium]
MASPFPAVKTDPATPTGELYENSEPILRVSFPSGHEGWLVTRYEDARLVLSDPRFSRALLYDGAPCLIQPGDFSTGERSILNLDPPDHTRLRRLAAQAFTARKIAALRPMIQRITDDLLDTMATLAPPADVIEHFAFPLPTAVMCEILGVPFGNRERFGQWSQVIVTPLSYTPELVEQARADGARDMLELVVAKRDNPGEDILSALVHAQEGDDRLTDAELVDLGSQLLLAGHETTVTLLGTGLVLLFTHPDQLAALRADPDLTPSAIEEIMRYDGPIENSLLRVPLEDVEIAGTVIKKGEGVVAQTSAANRDPLVFKEPEKFDITRREGAQLGFGHGIHFCLGAALARLEAEVALRGLLARFPTLDLAIPPEKIVWRPPLSTRGPVAVPVTWR